jgi:hypothetical protein
MFAGAPIRLSPPGAEGLPRTRPALFAAGAVAAAWLLAAPVLAPTYGPNDDPVLSLIVSGRVLTLDADPHLFFSHIVVGRLLTSLHRTWPGVPWYGLYLIAGLVLAQVALAYAALLASSRPRVGALVVVHFLGAGLVLLSYFTFTVVATLMAAAGVLLGAVAARLPPTPRTRAVFLAASALAVCASLVRFEALFLALLLTAPAAAVLAAGMPRSREALAWAGAAALAAGGLRLLDAWTYARDPEWSLFTRFNAVRVLFTDYPLRPPDSPGAAAVLAQVGWQPADQRFLSTWWFHGDPEVYSLANLEHVAAGVGLPSLAERWLRAEDILWTWARDRRVVALVLLTAALVLACPRGRARLAVALSALTALGILAVLAWLVRAPAPVVLAVACTPSAVALVVAGAPRGGALGRPRVLLVTVLGAAAASQGAVAHARAAEARRAARADVARALEELRPTPESLFVAWGTAFPFEALSPLESPQALAPMRILSVGWSQRTPLAQRMLSAYGYGDALDALASGGPVVLLAPRSVLSRINEYMQRRRRVRLRWHQAFAAGEWGAYRAAAEPLRGAPAPPSRAVVVALESPVRRDHLRDAP